MQRVDPKYFLKIIRQPLLPMHDNQITRGIPKTPNHFPLPPDPSNLPGDLQTLFPGPNGLAEAQSQAFIKSIKDKICNCPQLIPIYGPYLDSV